MKFRFEQLNEVEPQPCELSVSVSTSCTSDGLEYETRLNIQGNSTYTILNSVGEVLFSNQTSGEVYLGEYPANIDQIFIVRDEANSLCEERVTASQQCTPPPPPPPPPSDAKICNGGLPPYIGDVCGYGVCQFGGSRRNFPLLENADIGSSALSDIYVVNSLSDSNTSGTLRHALTTARNLGKPRIVVFDIAGVIQLNSDLPIIDIENLHVAGQTAPNGGIAVKGGTMNVRNSDNIVFEHVDIYAGSETRLGADAMEILRFVPNILLSNMGFWVGLDETLSISEYNSSRQTPNRPHTEGMNVGVLNTIIGYGPLRNGQIATPNRISKGSIIAGNNNVLLDGVWYTTVRERAYKTQSGNLVSNNMFTYNTLNKSIDIGGPEFHPNYNPAAGEEPHDGNVAVFSAYFDLRGPVSQLGSINNNLIFINGGTPRRAGRDEFFLNMPRRNGQVDFSKFAATNVPNPTQVSDFLTGASLPNGVLKTELSQYGGKSPIGCMDYSQLNVLDAVQIPNFHLQNSGANPAQANEWLRKVRRDYQNGAGTEIDSFRSDVTPYLLSSPVRSTVTFRSRLEAYKPKREWYVTNGETGRTNIEDFLRLESKQKGGKG